MEDSDILYSSVPTDGFVSTLAGEKYIESDVPKNVSSALISTLGQEWEKNKDEEVVSSLDTIHKNLIKKVKAKSLQRIHRELVDRQSLIVDDVSQHMVNLYAKELIKKIRVDHTLTSASDKKEDVNVYIGYDTNSLVPVTKDMSAQKAIRYTYHPPYEKNEKQTVRFMESILLIGLFFLVVMSSALYCLSPFVFFSYSSIYMCVNVTILSIGFAFVTECMYKKKLKDGPFHFRWLYYPFKIIVFSLVFGFLLITQFDYHPIDPYYTASTFFLGWNTSFNQMISVIQKIVSSNTIRLMQNVLCIVAWAALILISIPLWKKKKIRSI